MAETSFLDAQALDTNMNIRARNYWKERLAGSVPEAYFHNAQMHAKTYSRKNYNDYTLVAPEPVNDRFNRVSPTGRSRQVFLLAVLSMVVQKCASRQDIVLFTPVYADGENRELHGRVIPFRSRPLDSMTFRDHVMGVKEHLLRDMEHGNYPLEKMFNIDEGNLKELPVVGLLVKGLQDPAAFTELAPDILFSVNVGDQLVFDIRYKVNLYAHDYIVSLAEAFCRLLQHAVDHPHKLLGELSLVSEEEGREIEEALGSYGRERVLAYEPVAASPHQERLWFIDQFETGYLYPGAPVYHNLAATLEWTGQLDIDALQGAMNVLIGRYRVLRTRLRAHGEQPFQQVTADVGFRWEQRPVAAPDADAETEAFISRPFGESGLLLRGLVLDIDPAHHRLVLVSHQSILDRFSLQRLVDQLGRLYAGQPAGEPANNIDYEGYTLWLQQRSAVRELEWLSYWRKTLNGLQPLELPCDRQRAAVHVYDRGLQPLPLDTPLRLLLHDYAARTGLSTEVLLLGLFQLLLHKYCRQQDIVVGTLLDNRPTDTARRIPGPLANLVPIRSRIDPDSPVADCLRLIAHTHADACRHGAMPFDKLVRELAPDKDMSRTALFDVLYHYERHPAAPWQWADASVCPTETHHGSGKYDLDLLITESPEGLQGYLAFNRCYYQPGTIDTLAQRYTRLIGQALQQPQRPVSELELMTEAEQHAMNALLDQSTVAWPGELTISALFGRQVARHGTRIAVKANGMSFSYAELDARSNAVAHVLRSAGVQPDTIVGLLCERSADTVIAMLAILKAGGAYLPIDVAYPPDRIHYLLQDSGCSVVVTQPQYTTLIPDDLRPVLLDEAQQQWPSALPLPEVCKPDNLAYVIYTSGTTGHPKGVMVEHRQVVRLFFNDNFLFDFDHSDVWTMFHSHSFDFSVWEIFGALLFGARVVILPKEDARDVRRYWQILIDEGVTVVNQTPSAFYGLQELALSADPVPPLQVRYVIFGGEALSPERLRPWKQRYPHIKLINMYGITETTVHVTYKDIGWDDMDQKLSNIGRPIPTLSIYLLDERLRPVAPGIAGELYIGGAGLARGYLRKPELTAQRFIPHPYRTGERLYRSGDLGRLLPTGEIEYLGRIDDQVQIRGFRIELGEVQRHLEAHSAITKCVVLCGGEQEDKYLVAYYTASTEIKTSALRTFLQQHLPEHMIPLYYVRIDQFPVTSNGKLDKKALPPPQSGTDQQYEHPDGPIEEQLADIWADVLRIDKNSISANTSFFELGGHSLRAMIMVNRLSKHFGVAFPLKALFTQQTIREQADMITRTRQHTTSSPDADTLRRAGIAPYYPLTPAQRRLYFLYQFDPVSLLYNLPDVLKVKGAMDPGRLEDSFRALIARHEALRTLFVDIDGDIYQQVADAAPFGLEWYAEGGREAEAVLEEFVRPFDLGTAPLMRVGVLELAAEEQLLLIDMHHIICDGVSRDILIRDLMALYEGRELPPPGLQYKDYAEWLAAPAQQQRILSHRDFWLGQFASLPAVPDLAADEVPPGMDPHRGAGLHFTLDRPLSASLRRLCEEEGVTPFMVLLSFYVILLGKLSGQDDIVTGVPVSGRDHADLEGIVGMFVNTLPIRNYPQGQKRYVDFLHEVRDRCLQCFDHQSYPYEQLIDELKLPRDTGHNPLFDVMFAYRNFEETKLSIPGLALEPYDGGRDIAKFDLTLSGVDRDGRIDLYLEYSTARFGRSTVERMAAAFVSIATQVLARREAPLAALSVLSGPERHELIEQYNATRFPYSPDATVVSLFEDHAARDPHRTAVLCHPDSLSYGRLHEQSNRIAHYLQQACGLAKGDPVGVLLPRNLELPGVLLGILKAGCPYVPIDPAYPPARKKTIIRDSAMRVVIVPTGQGHTLADAGCRVLELGALLADMHPCTGPFTAARLNGNDLAYIIYTSGSTGTPKGVMIDHAALHNYIAWAARYYLNGTPATFALYTSIAFDLTVTSLFTPLVTGGCIKVFDEQPGGLQITQVFADPQVDVIKLTPSHLRMVLESATTAPWTGLRRLIVGGENLETALARDICNRFDGRLSLYNEYGPTEATVGCMIHPYHHDDQGPSVPIGAPIDNMQVYLLDNDLEPAGYGVKGQLYLSGTGLARGYAGRQDLTAERFIDHPFLPGQRLYRTGDQAIRYPDGRVVYLGRLDEQIKLRGYRIEPGEIEQQLRLLEDIPWATVTLRGQADGRQLVAYYQCTTDRNPESIKEHLSSRLPSYMMPAHLVRIHDLPLTVNGKVDKDKLPEPQQQTETEPVAPATAMEERLARIWADILMKGGNAVGVETSFFELGGNSLSAVRLRHTIWSQLGVNIPLRMLFEQVTVRTQARVIGHTGARDASIPRVEDRSWYPASPAQQRLFYEQLSDSETIRYNVSGIYLLREGPDPPRLARAFRTLIERHEGLRTGFSLTEQGVIQQIHDDLTIEIPVQRLKEGQTELDAFKAFVQPFDLTAGKPIRCTLLQTHEGLSYLLVDIHHIVCDGVSLNILMNDFKRIYQGQRLEPVALRYRDYACWQAGRTTALEEQKEFWRRSLAGKLPVFDLPVKQERGLADAHPAFATVLNIDGEVCHKIREMTAAWDVSEFMFLLSVQYVLMHKLSGSPDIIIGTDVTGRSDPALQDIVGTFVNVLPLRIQADPCTPFREVLTTVKECVLAALDHQDFQYDQIIDLLRKENKAREQLFHVHFSFQNILDGGMEENAAIVPCEPERRDSAHFEITIEIRAKKERFELLLLCSRALYTDETARLLTAYYQAILQKVIDDPGILLEEIDL